MQDIIEANNTFDLRDQLEYEYHASTFINTYFDISQAVDNFGKLCNTNEKKQITELMKLDYISLMSTLEVIW